MSKEALRRFGGRGRQECASDHGAEDVEFGRCMENLGVSGVSLSKTYSSEMQCSHKSILSIISRPYCYLTILTFTTLMISGVRTGDSRDAFGRSRFHCFNPETHLHGGYPDWYYQYDKYGARKVSSLVGLDTQTGTSFQLGYKI